MTYQSSEISVASGQPVELYDIAYGDTHWHLTSSGENITYATYEYESAPCKRTEIEQTGEIPKDALELELPRNHALGLLCITGPPEEEVTLTIYRGHGAFYVTHFKGFLTSVKMDGDAIPKCTFEPRSSDLPFVGGRRRCMRLCGHVLYGYRCGVVKDTYDITGTIESISDDGLTLTASEFGEEDIVEPDVYGDLTKLAGCTYSANVAASYAYKVFNGSISSFWSSTYTYANNWIYCKWTLAQTIKKIRIRPGYTSSIYWATEPGEGCMKHFRVAGSNDGTNWTTIPVSDWEGNCEFYGGYGGNDTLVSQIGDSVEWIEITLDNITAYTYYRLWIYDHWMPAGGSCSLIVNEIEMIEADNAMEVYSFGAGGIIQVGSARRMITSQVGNTVTISRKFGSEVTAGSGGSTYIAYPGCDHTPSVCHVKFSNIINYGGQEHLPLKNPYAGDLIY